MCIGQNYVCQPRRRGNRQCSGCGITPIFSQRCANIFCIPNILRQDHVFIIHNGGSFLITKLRQNTIPHPITSQENTNQRLNALPIFIVIASSSIHKGWYLNKDCFEPLIYQHNFALSTLSLDRVCKLNAYLTRSVRVERGEINPT